jgi:aminopeptidase-like protein
VNPATKAGKIPCDKTIHEQAVRRSATGTIVRQRLDVVGDHAILEHAAIHTCSNLFRAIVRDNAVRHQSTG